VSCSSCKSTLTVRPNVACRNVAHWQTWSKRLELVIEEANNALFDSREDDIEHQITSHADTLPQVLRQVAAGHEKALHVLQAVIQERFD